MKTMSAIFAAIVAVIVFAACNGPTNSSGEVITVTVDGIDRISVTPPVKTSYSQSGFFSSAGLVVKAHYTDGSVVTVNEGYSLYWNGQPLSNGNTAITGQLGDKIISVDWRGKTASFTVYVSNENTLPVTNTDQWNYALSFIRDGGNHRDYTITVNGNVPVSGSTDNTFGTTTDLTITLNGNGKLYLDSPGNMIRLTDDQTLYIDGPTLEGLIIDANGATQNNNAALVYINSATAKLELQKGMISGNTNPSGDGGGVYVNGGGSFTMSGGTISGNAGNYGGGVYNRGNFSMMEGTISGNSGNGGGVFVNNGSFTMSGGFVRDNAGGGVFVYSSGSFTMSGGTVSGNTSTSNGGGVYVNNNGSFTMSGGFVSGNTSTYTGTIASYGGGGVYVYTNGSFSKSGGGIIYGNDTTVEEDKNTASGSGFRGQAVYYYVSTSTIYYRDTTLDTGDDISTTGSLPTTSGQTDGGWTRR